jgi:HK97 family phage portal protein
MLNPDPLVYNGWFEFSRSLFWEYMLGGEVFILAMSRGADGYPLRFRVIPGWLMNVEMRGGTREYRIGLQDVTDDILHIRYQSSTDDARGHGPLECAGARMTAAGLLQRYAQNLVECGGIPQYWIEVERRLSKAEAADLLDQWVESRIRHAGHPALMSGGASLRDTKSMSAKDMSLLELSQFNESRIAVALGVPPFLLGLPSGGDSLTYSNVSSLFDFHDRASLRPKAVAVMQALSNWALPRGQSCELNRDEYSRPALKERAESYQILAGIGAISVEEIRAMERLNGEAPAVALTGGDTTGATFEEEDQNALEDTSGSAVPSG